MVKLMKKIAQIFVNTTVKSITKPYTYLIPSELSFLDVGWRVVVPFGKQKMEGFIVKVEESNDADNLKSIIETIDSQPWFDNNMLETAKWISSYYLCSLVDALRLFIPGNSGIKINILYKIAENVNFNADFSAFKFNEILQYIIKSNKAWSLLDLSKVFLHYDCKIALDYLIEKKLLVKEYEIKNKANIKVENIIKLNPSFIEDKNFFKNKPAQQKVLNYLANKDILTTAELKILKISRDTINALKKHNAIIIEEHRVLRNSYDDLVGSKKEITLNPEQSQALLSLNHALTQQIYAPFLLYGITGSGKTQVYIEITKKVIKSGKQAIVLVPEIALTSQIVKRFKAEFDSDVVVIHSKLSISERNDVFTRIRTKDANIVIGARSAVFAPVVDLGIIIMDEEHDFSYKQEESPKYNTVNVAQQRLKLSNGLLLLGSATPALNTYFAALNKKITLLKLSQRIDNSVLPAVNLVDMRDELKKGRRKIISHDLHKLISSTLAVNEQIILLLNRRGFSTFILCRECGYVMTCDSCAATLVYHNSGKLQCHYCHKPKVIPDICPKCSSRYIKYFGTGTQRLEEELQKEFPQAKIARMDYDTTKGKFSHDKIINDFKEKKFDILLGTQMVAKGHDIKNVTAVGIISADSALNIPDFRSAERTFALLTQAAGRAGRGEIEGKVIIQTYNANHYVLLASKTHDYEAFYQEEILYRKQLNYPPFTKLIKLTFYNQEKNIAQEQAQALINELRSNINLEETDLLGPFTPPIEKINNLYRYNILIKAQSLDSVKKYLTAIDISSRANISIDVDPMSII